MRIKSLFLSTIILMVFLSACANNTASSADSTGEVLAPTVSASDSSGTDEIEEPPEQVASSFEPVEDSASSESVVSGIPESASDVSDGQTSKVTQSVTSESASEPVTQTPTQAETSKPTEAPSVSSEPEPTPEPTPSTPVEPVVSTEPSSPESAFDVSQYVNYAKSYGDGCGLTLDSSAVSCWDDPLTANASCNYLERDIKDRLDWYAASGCTAFWVWSESSGNGNYLIYIGYA